MIRIPSVFLLLLFTVQSWAQDNAKIFGKVVDEIGEVLTGASIIYRTDVSIGAIADFDGKYVLSVPSGKCKLICRYTGMKSDTITLNLNNGEEKEVMLFILHQHLLYE